MRFVLSPSRNRNLVHVALPHVNDLEFATTQPAVCTCTMYSRRPTRRLFGPDEMMLQLLQVLNAPRRQVPAGMVWHDVQRGEIPPEASTRGQWCSQCGRKFRGGPEDAIGWQWARNPNPPTFNNYVVRCACCNPGYDCPDCADEVEERKLEEGERKKNPKRTKKRQKRGSKRSARSIATKEAGANTKKPRRSARIKAAASKATKGK